MPAHNAVSEINLGLQALGGAAGRYLYAGTTVPTDATAGYAPGALFIHSDGVSGGVLYINQGSITSCDFNAAVDDGSTQTLTAKTLSGATMSGTKTDTSNTTNSGTQTFSSAVNVSRTGELIEDDYDPGSRTYHRFSFDGRAYSAAVISDWSNFKSVKSANMDWYMSKSATAATARGSSNGGMVLSASNSSAVMWIAPRPGSRLAKLRWDTSKSPRFRLVFQTGTITNARFLIGLESTNRPKFLRASAPDSNRVEIYLDQNADSRLHVRVGGSSTGSSSATLAGVIASTTVYDLDIRVSSSRIVTVYVNGTLLYTSTLALAAATKMIPVIGFQSEGAKRNMTVFYGEMSQGF